MGRLSVFVLFILQSLFCQALVCRDIFSLTLYENAQANQVALEILDISRTMVESSSVIQKNVLQFRMNQKSKKLAKLLTEFKNHPDPLFVVPQFNGEFYWETTVSIRVGTLQTRTPYLTASQREDMRFELSGQQVYYGKEKIPLDKHIIGDFVIGMNGEMYIAYNRSELPQHFRHSSFFAGGPVLFAGVIGLSPDGGITYLSRKSGHYRPSVDYFVWVQEYLKSLGYRVPENLVDRIEE